MNANFGWLTRPEKTKMHLVFENITEVRVYLPTEQRSEITSGPLRHMLTPGAAVLQLVAVNLVHVLGYCNATKSLVVEPFHITESYCWSAITRSKTF